MKQNQNPRQNRQGRSSQHNKPNQHNNQKRPGKGRHNHNRNNQQPNSPNRQVDSRGPGGSVRGNAKQLYEKYKTLAQEKRASDRLESESLFQHADHYYRIYAEFAAAEAATQVAREKERTRKADAEAERRENLKTEEQAPATPAAVPSPDQANNVQTNMDTPEVLTLDLDVPKKSPKKASPKKTLPESSAPETPAEQQTDEKAPPKKRRGRPPKVKVDADAET